MMLGMSDVRPPPQPSANARTDRPANEAAHQSSKTLANHTGSVWLKKHAKEEGV